MKASSNWSEIIEVLPYFFMAVWAIFSIYYINRAFKRPNRINKYIFESIPQIFATIGILGTFIGIAYGLHSFKVNDIESSIPQLLEGLKTAFYASIIGIIALIISSKIIAIVQKGYEKIILSDETVALNKIVDLLNEMKADINNNAIEFNNNFILTDDNNNKAKPANVFRDIYEESRKQSQALQSFSTSMADTITAGFEKLIGEQNTLSSIPYLEKLRQEITLLSNKQDKIIEEFKTSLSIGFSEVIGQQKELDTIPHLEKLTQEIESFGSKQKDSTSEMTQNVANDISVALGKMIDEFKDSMSGNTKKEFENLATLLNSAGNTLIDFPVKIQTMTDNLNSNFKDLQQVVQNISRQTLSQTEETTGTMKRQVEEMSKILNDKVGDLQVGQEVLLTKQTENLNVSANLLGVFNTSIEKMNSLSVEVNETIRKFDKVQNELNAAASQLKSVSENASTTSESFKNSQLNFSEHSNQFLSANKTTIEEIKNSLVTAKDVSADFAQKFLIIEKGLQSIFQEIQNGLDNYSKNIGSSLESYLGGYSKALNSTVESLAGQSAKHEDILDALTDQLSKLNQRKN